jgi:hypothetical protein
MCAIYAKAGDTGFTHSDTLLGKLIRWGERDQGEAASWANHTFVVVESGWIGPGCACFPEAIVIEALWKTRRGTLKLNGTKVRVFRPVPAYTPEELQRFIAEAETYVGAKYGWWKLGVQLADRMLFRGKKVLTTALFMKSRPICSFLAAFVNQAAENAQRKILRLKDAGPGVKPALAGLPLLFYAFGLPPQAADPDSMMDYCLAHPEWWREVTAFDKEKDDEETVGLVA